MLDSNKFNKLYNKILAILFLAFIFTIPLLNILTPAKQFSSSENRTLQQLPKFTLKHLTDGSYAKNFETYISDQFFMRDNWVYAKSSIEKTIGKKDNNGVYLGKDGYLLQTFEGKDKYFDSKIEAINSFANSNKNIALNFMIIPNSVKVMSNKLPSYASPVDELDYINKIKKNLNPSINFIDAYNALLAQNDKYIYYRTDHHWTTEGAYYAYKEAGKTLGFTPHETSYFNIRTIADNFYGTLYSKSGYRNVTPDSIQFYVPKITESHKVEYSDINTVSDSLYNMEDLKKKDKYAAFLDGNHSLVHISTNNNSSKSLLLIKDSYANSFIPFLTGHYSDIYIVDFRYYTDNFSEFIKTKNIKDILILYNVSTFSEDTGIESITD